MGGVRLDTDRVAIIWAVLSENLLWRRHTPFAGYGWREADKQNRALYRGDAEYHRFHIACDLAVLDSDVTRLRIL